MGEDRHVVRGSFVALFVALLGCGGKSLTNDASEACEPFCDAGGGTTASTGGVSMTGGVGAGGGATAGVTTGGASTGGSGSRLGRPCWTTIGDTEPVRRLTAIDIDRTLDEVFGPGPPLEGSWPRTRTKARSPITADELGSLYIVARERAATFASERLADGSEPCSDALVMQLWPGLYRRSLTESELQGYIELCQVQAATERAAGIRAVVEAMILSPFFVFRTEVVDETGALSSIAVATRMSYFLWRSGPSAELFEAASRNELAADDQVESWAFKMLDDPRAHFGMARLLSETLGIDDFSSSSAAAALPDAIGPDMAEQSTRFLESFSVEDQSTLERLLTSNQTWLNDSLAGHYGVTAPGTGRTFAEVTLDADRSAGILTHGAWLVTAPTTTRRGKLVRRGLLCEDIIDEPHDDLSADAGSRENYEALAADPACGSCHGFLDPTGFAFFGYDEQARPRAGRTDGVIYLNDKRAFDGPHGLGGLLAESAEAAFCVAHRAFDYAIDRVERRPPALELPDVPDPYVSSSVEDCVAASFIDRGRDLRVLAVELVKSSAFRRHVVPVRGFGGGVGATALEHAISETERLGEALPRQPHGTEIDAFLAALREIEASGDAPGD